MRKRRRARDKAIVIYDLNRAREEELKVQRSIHTAAGSLKGHQTFSPGLTGWFQFRKRAQQRLRNLSNGNLSIHESGYRGDHVRHLTQDLRCEHVFRVSIKEVITGGADSICPFCNGTRDMDRYGSIEAVQEHVHCITLGQAEFLADNILLSSKDNYRFFCLMHRIIFEATFDEFLARNGTVCPLCVDEWKSIGNDV